MPNPLPFVWLVVHGVVPEGAAVGMPTAMKGTGARCLLLGEGQRGTFWGDEKHAAPGGPATPVSIDQHRAETSWAEVCNGRIFGLRKVVGDLFGLERGVHFFNASARDDALSFCLSEMEEIDDRFVSIPGLAPTSRANRLHLWVRDGLAWRNPQPGQPHVHPAFPDLPELHGTAAGKHVMHRLGGLPKDTPFGVALIDAPPSGPSAHHILETERRLAEDLNLMHAWTAKTWGEPPRRAVLVRA